MSGMTMVEGIDARGMRHCETTALGVLLRHEGVDLSEPMLFGLGSGLSFVYWDSKAMGFPFLGGRVKPFELTRNLAAGLGLGLLVDETTSPRKAWQNVAGPIDAGRPVGLQLDSYHLDYFRTEAHFGGHVVAMYGYDEQDAYLVDTEPQGGAVSTGLAALARARAERGPMSARHRSFTLTAPGGPVSPRERIVPAIRACADTFLNPPIANLGHRGIGKAAEQVPKWLRRTGSGPGTSLAPSSRRPSTTRSWPSWAPGWPPEGTSRAGPPGRYPFGMSQPPVPDVGRPANPDVRRPANGGPKAAARNRAALIAAAREIYAAEGLDAPLSAIARRAGVGQGVLYRHFPDRDAVATAVLEENVRQIEEAAAADDMLFADVLGVLTWHLTESAAFLGLLHMRGSVARSGALAHAMALSDRVERALRERLPDGHRLGARNDLMLAVAMVSGAAGGPTREARERRAAAAWELLGVEVGPVRPFGA